MGLFSRSGSSSSGTTSGATTRKAKAARKAQNAFVRDAGPASGWTTAQRQEYSRRVSETQNAELGR